MIDPKKLDDAIEKAKSFLRMGYISSFAIMKASKAFNIPEHDIAAEMSRRSDISKKTAKKKTIAAQKIDNRREKQAAQAQDLCKECGHPLEMGDQRCPLCGEISEHVHRYEGLTIEDIAVNIKELCEDGLKPSSVVKLRRSLRCLVSDMHHNSGKYLRPMDRGIIVEIKKRGR